MNRHTIRSIVCTGAAAAMLTLGAASAFAQGPDTVRVLFRVNTAGVNNIAAELSANGDCPTAAATVATRASGRDTLLAVSVGTSSVLHGRQQQNAPALVRYNRGSLSLNLHPQQYGGAEISMYAVNGRRVINKKINAANGTHSVSQSNLTAGVYMLSVKGADGNSFAARLAHSGGKLNINAAFDGGNPALAKTANMAACGEWTLTLKADGYEDYDTTFSVANAANGEVNLGAINLTAEGGVVTVCTPSQRQWTNVNYGGRKTLDIRLPSSGNGPFPLAIFIIGGGFMSAGKQYGWVTSTGNNRGYAVASIDYTTGKSFPEGAEDVLAGIRHLRANASIYCLDPDKFAITGHSAGGYYAGLATVLSGVDSHEFDNPSLGNAGVSSKVQAGAGSCGLSDFTQLNKHHRESNITPMMPHNSAIGSYIGQDGLNLDSPNATQTAIFRRTNPMTYVTTENCPPPLLMQSARNDNVVPWQQSKVIVDHINSVCGSGSAVHDDFQTGGHNADNSSSNATRVWEFIDNALGVTR